MSKVFVGDEAVSDGEDRLAAEDPNVDIPGLVEEGHGYCGALNSLIHSGHSSVQESADASTGFVDDFTDTTLIDAKLIPPLTITLTASDDDDDEDYEDYESFHSKRESDAGFGCHENPLPQPFPLAAVQPDSGAMQALRRSIIECAPKSNSDSSASVDSSKLKRKYETCLELVTTEESFIDDMRIIVEVSDSIEVPLC